MLSQGPLTKSTPSESSRDTQSPDEESALEHFSTAEGEASDYFKILYIDESNSPPAPRGTRRESPCTEARAQVVDPFPTFLRSGQGGRAKTKGLEGGNTVAVRDDRKQTTSEAHTMLSQGPLTKSTPSESSRDTQSPDEESALEHFSTAEGEASDYFKILYIDESNSPPAPRGTRRESPCTEAHNNAGKRGESP